MPLVGRGTTLRLLAILGFAIATVATVLAAILSHASAAEPKRLRLCAFPNNLPFSTPDTPARITDAVAKGEHRVRRRSSDIGAVLERYGVPRLDASRTTLAAQP
jgi:hypothetical protein